MESLSTTGEARTTFKNVSTARTSSSSKPEFQEVLQVGHVPRGLELPPAQNRLEARYGAAMRSGREADWENFVKGAESVAKKPRLDELMWLIETSVAAPSNYRAASSLARAASTIALRSNESIAYVEAALQTLAVHASPEVRLTALEAAADTSVELAKRIVGRLSEDVHPLVRQAVASIISMS